MVGQEDEADAEHLTTIRLEHAKMKAWYHGSSRSAASVRRVHGDKYPTFWQDVVSWEGWKDVRRAYLRFTEGGGMEVEEEAEQRKEKEKAAAQEKDEADEKDEGDDDDDRGLHARAEQMAREAAERAIAGATSVSAVVPAVVPAAAEDEEKKDNGDDGAGGAGTGDVPPVVASSNSPEAAPVPPAADNGENREPSATAAPATTTAASAAPSKPRKRRSRWAASAEPPTEAELNGGEGQQDEPPTKRKSRWARENDRDPSRVTNASAASAESAVAAALGASAATTGALAAALPGLSGPLDLTPTQRTELSHLQAQLRSINEKLSNLEVEAERIDALPRDHPDRSPSPPPIYDAYGKRKNTRAVRWRERYGTARQDTLEKIMDLNPAMRPAGWTRRKRQKKIRVPVEEHPNYNFIGLIIGPRGKTQKELEAKTGCKIAIRGKGSVKEGAKGRSGGKPLEGEDEPLHVLITGDDPDELDEAGRLIEEMLVVIDDEVNVHKQAQLRELALLNGTLKDDEYCPICADRGHRAFECPKRFSSAAAGGKGGVTVKCAICGDTSHPTRDCVQNKTGAVGGGAGGADGGDLVKKAEKADEDYLNFMAELDGKSRAEGDVDASSAAKTSAMSGAAGSGAGGSSGGLPMCQPVGCCSAVTTISSTIEGRMKEAAPAPPPPSTGSVPGITIISSTVKTVDPAAVADAAAEALDKLSAAAADTTTTTSTADSDADGAPTATTTTTTTAAVDLPPPPSGPFPPPPSAPAPEAAAAPSTGVTTISAAKPVTLPPPPGGAPPPMPAGLPPPPAGAPPPVPAGLPPPPSQVPPPPPNANLPPPPQMPPPPGPPPQRPGWDQQHQPPPPGGGYQQPPPPYGYQQQQYGYPGQQPHQQPYGQQHAYGQGPPSHQYGGPPQGQGQQQQGGAGWDYRSYYGNAPTGGDAQGAGGFNWWDQE